MNSSVALDTPPDNWTANLRRAWLASVEIANVIAEEVDGVDLPGVERMRAAGAAWWVALEHHASITLLIRHEKHASAYALLRPQIDAYLRGVWLSSSASETEVASFLAGNNAPGAEKLVRRLEAEGFFDPDSITALHAQIWGAASDYTHTGSRQIGRHISASSIEPVHDPDELAELLLSSASWALMAAIGVASAAQQEERCERLLEAARSLPRSDPAPAH